MGGLGDLFKFGVRGTVKAGEEAIEKEGAKIAKTVVKDVAKDAAKKTATAEVKSAGKELGRKEAKQVVKTAKQGLKTATTPKEIAKHTADLKHAKQFTGVKGAFNKGKKVVKATAAKFVDNRKNAKSAAEKAEKDLTNALKNPQKNLKKETEQLAKYEKMKKDGVLKIDDIKIDDYIKAQKNKITQINNQIKAVVEKVHPGVGSKVLGAVKAPIKHPVAKVAVAATAIAGVTYWGLGKANASTADAVEQSSRQAGEYELNAAKQMDQNLDKKQEQGPVLKQTSSVTTEEMPQYIEQNTQLFTDRGMNAEQVSAVVTEYSTGAAAPLSDAALVGTDDKGNAIAYERNSSGAKMREAFIRANNLDPSDPDLNQKIADLKRTDGENAWARANVLLKTRDDTALVASRVSESYLKQDPIEIPDNSGQTQWVMNNDPSKRYGQSVPFNDANSAMTAQGGGNSGRMIQTPNPLAAENGLGDAAATPPIQKPQQVIPAGPSIEV